MASLSYKQGQINKVFLKPGIEMTSLTHPHPEALDAKPSLVELDFTATCLAVLLNVECPFRSLKVLLILPAEPINQFPGKDAVANF